MALYVWFRLLHNYDQNTINVNKDDAPNDSHSTTGQTIKLKSGEIVINHKYYKMVTH